MLSIAIMSTSQETGAVLCSSVMCGCSFNGKSFRIHTAPMCPPSFSVITAMSSHKTHLELSGFVKLFCFLHLHECFFLLVYITNLRAWSLKLVLLQLTDTVRT